MADPSIAELFDRYFGLIEQESFAKGRRWAMTLLDARSRPHHAWILEVEHDPEAPLPAAAGGLEPETLVALSAATYFSARITVESSYRYTHAVRLLERSGSLLEQLSGVTGLAFVQAVRGFLGLQRALCDIDRGIYTSQAAVMFQAARELAEGAREVERLCAATVDELGELLRRHLSELLSAYAAYAAAVERVAHVLSARWGDASSLEASIAAAGDEVEGAVQRLHELGSNIMATDLAPHLPALRTFLAARRQGSGCLLVERGIVTISYYAALDHDALQELGAALCGEGRRRMRLRVGAYDAGHPELDGMSDIWSGLAAKTFVATHTWSLPALSVVRRGRALRLECTLVYYGMGVFALSLRAPLEDCDVSMVRHVMGLGAPFALDEEIRCEEVERPLAFLRDYAALVFEGLCACIDRVLGEGTRPRLCFDLDENRFALLRADRVAEERPGGRAVLSAAAARDHFAFQALSLPQREVRATVDDWVMRAPAPPAENIAPVRYNLDEVLLVHPHEALVFLTEQPDWVRDQAEESVSIAAAIANLFQVTSETFEDRIRALAGSREHHLGLGEASIDELGAERERLEQELQGLEHCERELGWLLQVIDAGSMMTYPDHTRLMSAIFERMRFEPLRDRTHAVLSHAATIQSETLHDVGKLHDELKHRASRRMNRLLSAAMALVSIGAMKDLFELFNGAELGVRISGFAQFASLAGFMLLAVFVLMRGWQHDE